MKIITLSRKRHSKRKFLLLLCVILSGSSILLYAQNPADTIARRNTVKMDITSYWLYRNAFILSYERVVKPNQTFVVTGGYQNLPPLASMDSLKITNNTKASGFKLGAEYRFYLKKENKYNAPHGVYVGPYLSYHNFSNTRTIEVNNNGEIETADLNAKINILNPGVQIGYQFVINDRWTIDLVFIGPSVSKYRAEVNLDGNFSFDADDITNEYVQALIDRFPGLANLINDDEFSTNGKINMWAYGYRYQFHVGYHFGRIGKKKK